MKPKVIKAYILKELADLVRSKLIIMVYVMPTMIMLLFGYGIRMDVSHARTLLVDNDQSKYSRLLGAKFKHSRYFDTKSVLISEAEALRRIKQAEADIVIIIPSSFEKRLLHGQKSEIGVFVDAAFPTRATTMESYVQGVILTAAGEVSAPARSSKGTITINARSLFNQAMRDEDAIVPGLIGLVLLIAPAILAALLIVKEKERGTIFNFYASPVGRIEYLAAKLIPAFLLHSLNIFILFLIATHIFGVPFRGSFALYWFAAELYILISLSIGMLISVVTDRQIVAVVLTLIITIIPGFLYSGILMPISSMQGQSYIEAHIFPIMYFNHIVYDAFLVGEGLTSDKNVLYLAIMGLYIIILMTLGSSLLKKELR
jgi:ABC-type multidrug transport system permease subunit